MSTVLGYVWVVGGLYFCARVHTHHRRWPRTIGTYFVWPVLAVMSRRFRYLYFSRERRTQEATR